MQKVNTNSVDEIITPSLLALLVSMYVHSLFLLKMGTVYENHIRKVKNRRV